MNSKPIFYFVTITFFSIILIYPASCQKNQENQYKPAIPATIPAKELIVLDLKNDIFPPDGTNGRRTVYDDVFNTLTAIQGLVNRSSESKIYFLSEPTYYPDSWEKDSKFHKENEWMLDLDIYPVPAKRPEVDKNKKYPVLSYLLENYSNFIKGKVIYPKIADSELERDPNAGVIKYAHESAALGAALTACGIEDGIPVSTTVDDYIKKEGHHFPLIADTRCLKTNEAAFDWAKENYFRPETNRKFIGIFSYEHIYSPVFHDYFIANKAFVVVLNSKIESQNKRLEELLEEYPAGVPLLGCVVGNEHEFYNLGSKTTITEIGNTSATSSFIFNPDALPEPIQPKPLPVKKNGVYVSFYGGDGDAAGLTQNQNVEIFVKHRDVLDDIFFNMQVCTYYMDLNPPLMQYWMEQQSQNFCISTTLHGNVPKHEGGRMYFKKLHKYYYDHARNNLLVYNQLRDNEFDVSQYFKPYVKTLGWGNITETPSPVVRIPGTNTIQIQIVDGYHEKIGGDKEKAILEGIENSTGDEPIFILIKVTGGWGNGIIKNLYEIEELMNKFKTNPPAGREMFFCTPVDMAATWKKWKGVSTGLQKRDSNPEYPLMTY